MRISHEAIFTKGCWRYSKRGRATVASDCGSLRDNAAHPPGMGWRSSVVWVVAHVEFLAQPAGIDA